VGIANPFAFPVPNVSGVRLLRYQLGGCHPENRFPPAFAEITAIGTASIDAPTLNPGRRMQSLVGHEVHSTPIVVNLTDDNGDGTIDAGDIPEIAVTVEDDVDQSAGTIKVISGDDGRELFTAGAPALVSPWTELAAGDIDGDGLPEIVAIHADRMHVIAFEHDGAQKWISDASPMPTAFDGFAATGAVSIANLDAAGPPEIIVGATVFDADGRLLGVGSGTTGGAGLRSTISTVADVDLDGAPELVAGPTAYRLGAAGLSQVWSRTDRADGLAATANFDDDPEAEIVIVANGFVYMLNHDGTDAEVWNPPSHAPVRLRGNGQGGAPLVADVDGDGRPEIGVASDVYYTVLRRDGAELWTSIISDRTSNSTGSVAFDLDGDGAIEIIYRDENYLRIYRGSDGIVLATRGVGSATWAETPTVADVDNDGHADIVVASDQFRQTTHDRGIIVFNDWANLWTRTRRIWNQHAYHVTNVTENGVIPVVETPHWLIPSLNGFRTNRFVPGESPESGDSFTYVASDGVLLSNEATVRIEVRAVNGTPSFTSTPLLSAGRDIAYLYAARASDPDAGDILTFSLPTAPAGMTVEPESGLLRWTPSAAQLGSHEVVVKVADLRGQFALQFFTLTVGEPVTVPDVIGQPQAAAESAIVSAALSVGTIGTRHSPTAPVGTVVSQSPVGGTLAATGTPVGIVSSLGPAPAGTVPDVVGLTRPGAEADIVAAQFVVGIVSAFFSATVPAGVVMSQAPAGGTTADLGSVIVIGVSAGPPPGTLDVDGDGFTGDQGDCNDTDPSINPGALDTPGDGIDQNCNGVDSIVGDVTPPFALLEVPDDLAEVTMPTDIVGTALDTNLLRYTLSFAGVDDTTFTTIGSGTAAVNSGVLGRLDPTLLENGLYRVRLVVEDVNGRTDEDERVYRVTGQMKVGNLRLSFIDLSVPVAGIPISVVRTYDSRVKAREAFGVGWTLDLSRGSYRHNRTPGRGWIIRDQPFLGEELPCIGGSQETSSHLTEVRLSDVEWYTFALQITNANLGITGACEGVASFRFVDGTRRGATLEILDGTGVIYLRGGPPEVLDLQAFLDGESRLFDPGRVMLTRTDGTRVELDRLAGIARIADSNGNTLTFDSRGVIHSSGKSISFERDSSNRLIAITDPLGHRLTYSYDERGDLIEFVDQLGNATGFTYDGDHNLLQVVNPLGVSAARYEYDDDGRLVAVVDAAGNRHSMQHDLSSRREVLTDRLGNVTTVDYDERGNVLQRTNALGEATSFTYDLRDNVLTETNPLGQTRTFAYDAADNRVSETDALGQTTTLSYNLRGQVVTRTDPRGGITTNEYSTTGNLVSETDPTGSVTRYDYDQRGLLLRITNAGGHSRTYGYDSTGNETVAIDELGVRTTRSYDAAGNLLSEVRVRSAESVPESVTTRYAYDARRQPIQIIDPEGGVEVIAYSPTGQRVATTDPMGRQTSFAYDATDRLVATVFPDGSREQYEYDEAGRRVALTDVAGRRSTRAFDAAGRPVAFGHADGTSRRIEYDAASRPSRHIDENGHATTVSYDAGGRPISTTNAVGATTSFTFDPSGNLVRQLDPEGNATTHTFDGAGRVTRVTYADGTHVSTEYNAVGRVATRSDQAGQATRFHYNGRGELVEVVDPLGNRTAFAYDELGNRVRMTDALGRTTRYTFDRAGRLRSTTLPMGQTAVHQYDAAGNLTSTIDFNGELTLFAYDGQGRLNQRTLPGAEIHALSYTPTGKLATMTDPRGVTTYEYDLRDRPRLVRDPAGRAIEYQYDAVGNRTALTTPAGTTSFEYDDANRLIAVTDSAGQRVNIHYNQLGKPVSLTYPGGLATAFSYDSLQRLQQIVHTMNATTVASYDYSLGPRGERLSVQEHSGRRVAYSYDVMGRLTREEVSFEGSSSAVAFTYDAVGNRATRQAGITTTSYGYDANDRLTAAGAVTFAHDDNGNLTARTVAGQTTAYEYDTLGRLRQVSAGDGVVTRYEYDALNQRVRRISPTDTIDFLVDSFAPSGLSQVLLESDATGQIVTSYVYAGSAPLSQRRAGNTAFRLTDGQASTRMLATSSGAITDRVDYDAFGTVVARDGTTDSSFQFNGQEFDAASGLYHLRARDYDSLTGRFTGRDPFAGYLSDPVTLHPYLYAQNDPINKSDPSGAVTLAEVMLVADIVLTATTTAYDLYHGDYKGAALNVGMGLFPFGALFKALKWAGKAATTAARTADEIVNLPPGAITEVANLGPRIATEAAFAVDDIGRAVADEVASAGAVLSDLAVTTVDRAIRASTQREVIDVFLGHADELQKMYEAAKRVYLKVGATSAADLAYGLRRMVGQPGWHVKLCALASAHYVLTGQFDSIFAGQVEIAVNLLLRGSGYRCKPRDMNPNLY
jgi:RHS repeat-associated protein